MTAKWTQMWLVAAGMALVACDPALAQNQPTASAAPALTPNSLVTQGVGSNAAILRFYHGDFENIDIDREDLAFEQFFAMYLTALGGQCAAQLQPPAAVPVMTLECREITETRTLSGALVSRAPISLTDG